MNDLPHEDKADLVALCRSDPWAALARTFDLIKKDPFCASHWSSHSYVLNRLGKTQEAIDSIDRSIILKPDEPVYRFKKSCLLIDQLRFDESIIELNHGLELSDRNGWEYYNSVMYFRRAYCFIERGEFDLARADLAQVADDHREWVNGLVSKAELLARCERGQRS